ncbi:MAG: hypothetical protein ABIH48_00550 [Candidatus Falkowbacteria bacterium]
MNSHLKKTKSEKREELKRKKKIKTSKGGTVAGQISRTRTAGKYSGTVKKLCK